MKILFVIFFIFCFSILFAQNEIRFISFDYSVDANKPKIDTMIINDEFDKIDVHFIGKHMNLPDFMPKKFIDHSYKNEKVTIWYWSKDSIVDIERKAIKERVKKDSLGRLEYSEKYYRNIASYSYYYDSLSRVCYFSFNGCENCSRMNEEYIVIYDSSNRVVKLTEEYFFNETIEFIYDTFGDITEMRYYGESERPSMIIKRE